MACRQFGIQLTGFRGLSGESFPCLIAAHPVIEGALLETKRMAVFFKPRSFSKPGTELINVHAGHDHIQYERIDGFGIGSALKCLEAVRT